MSAHQRPRLTVQDLLNEPDLGLTLVAGKRGCGRQVGGVHISEMPDPTPWLAPRDVLLTTGLSLKNDPALQREFVHRLSEAGMAAVGYAAGITEEGAPPELREAAETAGLPLFEVGYHIPFRMVTSYIFTSLLSTDMHRLRRSLSVQNHLLSLLVEEKGADHLVSSLSMLLAATIVLYDADGAVVSLAPHRVRIDAAQADRIWQTYCDTARSGDLPREMAFDDLRLVFREVRSHGRMHRVLALAMPAREHLAEFADIVLTYAQKLLALELLRSRDSELLQRKLRADLLDELIAGSGDPVEQAGRLRAHHIDVERPLRVLLVESERPAEPRTSRGPKAEEQAEEARAELQEVIETALAAQGYPTVAMSRGDAIIVLLQPGRSEDEQLRSTGILVRGRIEERAPGAQVCGGLSDAFVGVEAVARACAQAREATRLARGSGLSTIALFNELGPSIRALENQSSEQLELFYASTIGALQAHDDAHHDELVRSLMTYLEEQRSVGRAAKRLYVHQNTMRYRLKKIESLLGIRLGDTEILVDLFLGLRSQAILTDRGRVTGS
jgi:purine catabolism regulator